MKNRIKKIKVWLMGLSFRTGVIILASCVIFYAISFMWFLMPLSYTAQGILWIIFFGLAKTAQYTGLLILGKVGLQRLKTLLKKSHISQPRQHHAANS